jgi:hypothetical protein
MLADARARRPMGLALGVSIVAHVLFFAIPMHRRGEGAPPASTALQGPLVVQLGAPEPLPPPVAEKPERATAQPARPRAEAVTRPRELTVPRSDRVAEPAPPPAPEPAPAPKPEPPFDMAALIQANRERRRAADVAALRATQPGSETGTGDAATANLNRNLQSLGRSDGTGGVFRVLRQGVRTGEFSFNGWRGERGKQWREVIEVDAGPGGDVERAIVRRMIALIREHYSGDFNWESLRVGRVVVLNAAPENNDALEDYLMREFFGTPVVKGGP